MTDEEIFQSLLERNNVVFSVEIRGTDKVFVIEPDNEFESKNRGYYGFYAEWSFDRAGKLLYHGVWE